MLTPLPKPESSTSTPVLIQGITLTTDLEKIQAGFHPIDVSDGEI